MNSTIATNQGGQWLPVFSLLVAAILWGVLWYPLRLLEGAGLSGLWTSLIIYLVVFVPSLPWLLPHLGVIRKMPGSILLLALFSGWTNVAFILAVLEGNVVRVVLLFYLSPMWTVLLGRVVLHEQLSSRSWLVLCIAMCGALVILWPTQEVLFASFEWADLLAISAGMAFAATNVMVRKTADTPIMIKMGAAWVGVILITAAGLLLSQAPVPQVSANVYMWAVALGWLGIFAMTLATQYGVTHMPVHRSAVIMLFEVVVTAISVWYLSDESMSPVEWFGGGLVLVAALLSALSLRDEIAN